MVLADRSGHVSARRKAMLTLQVKALQSGSRGVADSFEFVDSSQS